MSGGLVMPPVAKPKGQKPIRVPRDSAPPNMASGGMVFRPLPKNEKENDVEDTSKFLDDMDELEMPPTGAEVPGMDDVEGMVETASAGPDMDLSAIPDDVLQAELDKRKGGNPMGGAGPGMPGAINKGQQAMAPQEVSGGY